MSLESGDIVAGQTPIIQKRSAEIVKPTAKRVFTLVEFLLITRTTKFGKSTLDYNTETTEKKGIKLKSAIFLTTDTISSFLDRRISQQAKILSSLGFSVQIVGHAVGQKLEISTSSDNLVSFLGIPRSVISQKVSYALTSANGFERFLLGIARKCWRLYKRSVGQFKHTNILTSVTTPMSLKLEGELGSIDFEQKIDLIICCDLPPASVALKLKRETGAVLVYDAHEFYSEQESVKHVKTMLVEIEKVLISEADITFTVNKNLCNLMKSKLNVIGKIEEFTNCASPEITDSERNFRLDSRLLNDDIAFVYHGWLTKAEGRNMKGLIKSFSKIYEPNIYLIIIGFGDTEFIHSLINEFIAINVILLPGVQAPDLHAYLSGADYFVIPYVPNDLNNLNAFPNKLGDAISLQVPIVYQNNLEYVASVAEKYSIGTPLDFLESGQCALAIEELVANNPGDHNWSAAESDLGWRSQSASFAAKIQELFPIE